MSLMLLSHDRHITYAAMGKRLQPQSCFLPSIILLLFLFRLPEPLWVPATWIPCSGERERKREMQREAYEEREKSIQRKRERVRDAGQRKGRIGQGEQREECRGEWAWGAYDHISLLHRLIQSLISKKKCRNISASCILLICFKTISIYHPDGLAAVKLLSLSLLSFSLSFSFSLTFSLSVSHSLFPEPRSSWLRTLLAGKEVSRLKRRCCWCYCCCCWYCCCCCFCWCCCYCLCCCCLLFVVVCCCVLLLLYLLAICSIAAVRSDSRLYDFGFCCADFRLMEAIASGALIFVDHMWVKLQSPEKARHGTTQEGVYSRAHSAEYRSSAGFNTTMDRALVFAG